MSMDPRVGMALVLIAGALAFTAGIPSARGADVYITGCEVDYELSEVIIYFGWMGVRSRKAVLTTSFELTTVGGILELDTVLSDRLRTIYPGFGPNEGAHQIRTVIEPRLEREAHDLKVRMEIRIGDVVRSDSCTNRTSPAGLEKRSPPSYTSRRSAPRNSRSTSDCGLCNMTVDDLLLGAVKAYAGVSVAAVAAGEAGVLPTDTGARPTEFEVRLEREPLPLHAVTGEDFESMVLNIQDGRELREVRFDEYGVARFSSVSDRVSVFITGFWLTRPPELMLCGDPSGFQRSVVIGVTRGKSAGPLSMIAVNPISHYRGARMVSDGCN